MWIQIVLKKHLLKRILQYFSSTAIGPTMNQSLTGCLERMILQEIHVCECKAKAASNSKVEIGLLWRIPLSLLAASTVQFVLQALKLLTEFTGNSFSSGSFAFLEPIVAL